MTSNKRADPRAVMKMTADVISAYISHNQVDVAALPQLLKSIHAALSGLGMPAAELQKQPPAVPVESSVPDDHLISLEDGRR